MALIDKLNAIGDAIRAKTGKTDKLTLDQMPLEIASITGGGGGSGEAVVWFVTFIGADGSALYKMPVLDGDDCKDPITHGDISTPTKESTASQVFTYNGWALTAGGSADSNALKAVTEDKTVYAAFTESVRYYTVRFFDGETLLTSKQVAYGGSATHSATKENYILSGWNPDPSNVTEDMDCYAVWEEFQIIPFAEASWEYISMVSQMGIASKVFSLGDTKTIAMKWPSSQEIALSIAEFDCPEKNGKTAMALIPTTLPSGVVLWNSSQAKGATSYSEFISTTYYLNLKNSLVPGLPSELQAVMKEGLWKGSGTGYINITALRPTEVGLAGNGTGANATNTDKCLYGFSNTNASRIRKDKTGTARNWWLLGIGSDITSGTTKTYPIYVDNSGYTTTQSNRDTSYHIMFKIFV